MYYNTNKTTYEMILADVDNEATGRHLKEVFREKGLSVRNIMEITGITSEQAIYKWFSGRSLPSLTNWVVLSIALDMNINELLVIDEEFGRIRGY